MGLDDVLGGGLGSVEFDGAIGATPVRPARDHDPIRRLVEGLPPSRKAPPEAQQGNPK